MTLRIGVVARDNLTGRVYEKLRRALMEGAFWPGDRLKIRDVAAQMGVSETPVREAVMQLVCERGLDMRAAKSITVAELSLAKYLELRSIRLHLEGMAAEAACKKITKAGIRHLKAVHRQLTEAEAAGEWQNAVRKNWEFHHTLYQAAELPELLAIIEGIWLRNGPLINYQYPHARPTYPGRHQHLNVISALEKGDPAAVSAAIKSDMIEGGALLVRLLERIERGEIDKKTLRYSATVG
jgi:DNA-binding GntR family transcriptional regulator